MRSALCRESIRPLEQLLKNRVLCRPLLSSVCTLQTPSPSELCVGNSGDFPLLSCWDWDEPCQALLKARGGRGLTPPVGGTGEKHIWAVNSRNRGG